MSIRFAPFRLLALVLFLSACAGPRSVPPASVERVQEHVRTLAAEFSPDRRTARFDVEAGHADSRLVISGETDQPEALRRLLAALESEGIEADVRVRVLPDTAGLGTRTWALVNVSVANLRTMPRHSAELATQVLLGTPLRVLRQESGFFLVQTPERYLGWVDGGGIERVDITRIQAHRSARRVVFLQPHGVAVAESRPGSAPVADLTVGALLEVTGDRDGFFAVRFPDGRQGFVARSEARPYDEWLRDLRAAPTDLVATARTFLGVPYLWGGTSARGLDCSGFTKTVYLLHGFVLPRDASQQIHAGVTVDQTGDWSALRPGDLLFFGSPARADRGERVVHVGMWLGDGEFIHAAGRVRINSMDPAAPNHDASELARYLRSRRILDAPVGVGLLQEGGLYALLDR